MDSLFQQQQNPIYKLPAKQCGYSRIAWGKKASDVLKATL